MKLKKGVLLQVTQADLDEKGRFINKEVKEVAEGCFYQLPNLTEVILPNCEKVADNCFRSNKALTSVSLPALTTCGGYCFSDNQALTSVSLYKKELAVKNVDGWPFIIEGKRTSKGIAIYNGYNFYSMKNEVVEKQDCYVAEKDGFTAHGETVKKAIADLQFKIVAEKLKNEPIKADTMITVNHYRLVTGACELGVKAWMQQNGLTGTEEMRADALLPILKKTNAYGLERFTQLIDF